MHRSTLDGRQHWVLHEQFVQIKQAGGWTSEEYWVAGDDAYVSHGRLLTPRPGRGLSFVKYCYKYGHSSAQTHTNQAILIIAGRWGVLWRPLRTSLRRAPSVAAVCCKQYNFIIDSGGRPSPPAPSSVDARHRIDSPAYPVHLQHDFDLDTAAHFRRRDLEVLDLRLVFTEYIEAFCQHHPRRISD